MSKLSELMKEWGLPPETKGYIFNGYGEAVGEIGTLTDFDPQLHAIVADCGMVSPSFVEGKFFNIQDISHALEERGYRVWVKKRKQAFSEREKEISDLVTGIKKNPCQGQGIPLSSLKASVLDALGIDSVPCHEKVTREQWENLFKLKVGVLPEERGRV